MINEIEEFSELLDEETDGYSEHLDRRAEEFFGEYGA